MNINSESKYQIREDSIEIQIKIPLNGPGSIRELAENCGFRFPEVMDEQAIVASRFALHGQLERKALEAVLDEVKRVFPDILPIKEIVPEIFAGVFCGKKYVTDLDIGPWLSEATNQELIEFAEAGWESLAGDEPPDIIEWNAARGLIPKEIENFIHEIGERVEAIASVELLKDRGSRGASEAMGTSSMPEVLEWLAKNRPQVFKYIVTHMPLPKRFASLARVILERFFETEDPGRDFAG